MQIDVAVDEIFGNICHYAYPLRAGEATVFVEMQEEREIGGLGIFIVKKTMDEISYRYENEKNILTVKKYMK